MNLIELLRELISLDASELYLVVGAVPAIQKDRKLGMPSAASGRRLEAKTAENFARSLMSDEMWQVFLRQKEVNLIYTYPGVGRFRVNVFRQRGSVGLVFRRVKTAVPSLAALGLPKFLGTLALSERGIILITGPANSGKDTTLASMINHRNVQRAGHIVTIENPIKYLLQHQRSIVTQREIGVDTNNVEEALENVLLQRPAVISVGELESEKVAQFLFRAAEAGHLVFATLHARNAAAAVERVLSFFPAAMRESVLNLLADTLRAIVVQRLVTRVSGGKAPALEILLNNPVVAARLRAGTDFDFEPIIQDEVSSGMLSMNQSLARLVKRGVITQEEALDNTESLTRFQETLQVVEIEAAAQGEVEQEEFEFGEEIIALQQAEAAALASEGQEDGFLPEYSSRRVPPLTPDTEPSPTGEATPAPEAAITPEAQPPEKRQKFPVPSHATPAKFNRGILTEEDLLGGGATPTTDEKPKKRKSEKAK